MTHPMRICRMAIQFTILFNLSTPSPAKTTIILNTEPNIKLQSVTVQNENIQEMEIIYKEKTCRIKFPYWIGHTSASISSDSKFLILDGNGFINISDLENCDKNDVDFQEISSSFTIRNTNGCQQCAQFNLVIC